MNDILRQYEKPLHWNVILALLWQNSVRVAGNFTNNSLIIFKCLTDIECFRLTGQLRTGTLNDFHWQYISIQLCGKESLLLHRPCFNQYVHKYLSNASLAIKGKQIKAMEVKKRKKRLHSFVNYTKGKPAISLWLEERKMSLTNMAKPPRSFNHFFYCQKTLQVWNKRKAAKKKHFS